MHDGCRCYTALMRLIDKQLFAVAFPFFSLHGVWRDGKSLYPVSFNMAYYTLVQCHSYLLQTSDLNIY